MIKIGFLLNHSSLGLLQRVWRTIDVEPHLSLVLTLSSPEVIASVKKNWGFDVFIIDGKLERYGKLGVSVDSIKRKLPETKIVVLHEQLSTKKVKVMHRQGVLGHVSLKNIETALVPAVEFVSRNEAYLDSIAISDVVFSLPENPEIPEKMAALHERLELLSIREREVYRLLASGNSYQEISQELSIAIKTVRGYRTAIFRKLEIGSYSELVRSAIALQLIKE